MHWTTDRHIPGEAPEKPTRPQARQVNSSLDAASSTLQDYTQPEASVSPRHSTIDFRSAGSASQFLTLAATARRCVRAPRIRWRKGCACGRVQSKG